MAVSAYIQSCIDDILTGVYGRDVRQAIHDALEYTTGIVGTYDSRLEALEALSGSIIDGLSIVNGAVNITYTTNT